MAATITVVCPQCQHRMRASTEHVGKSGKCPVCKALVQIAAPLDESFSPTLAPVADAAPATGIRANTLLAGLFGVAATALLYGAVFYPLAKGKYWLGTFMCERGLIQHTITLVTCWGLALLVLRYLAVRRELDTADLELELIPLEIGLQITPDNLDQFLGHVDALPAEQSGSILGRRIRGALEHFKHRHSVPEVQTYAASQAELEASAVDSGYTLLRAFIWVCPILGFIGTVQGISQAITGLEGFLASNPDAVNMQDALMNAMRNVTKNLAVAFDTTYLGLVCVVILMFPTEALRKIEFEMLDRVEGFANESLVRRMADDGGAGTGEMPEVVRATLESAFKEHQKWLAQWQAQVARLGQEIGRDFEVGLAATQERLAQAEAARLDKIDRAAHVVEEMFAHAVEASKQIQPFVNGDLQASVHTMDQVQKSLAANTKTLQQVFGAGEAGGPPHPSADLGVALRELQHVVAKLAERLDSAPTGAFQPVPAPRTSDSMIGRFFGRNRR